MGELFLHDLEKYIDLYGCKVFFETGTGMATGLKYAMQHKFEVLISAEINREIYEANLALREDGRVKLLNMDSVSALRRLDNLYVDTPMLFWLDAHFPGADFGKGKYDDPMDEVIRLPLESELKVIKELRPNGKDVLIIDDLQLYEEGPFELKYPPFVDRFKRKPDFIYEIFQDTHKFKKDYRHQGFLILEPK